MAVWGVIMTSRGVPIPGCLVQLINQDVGASNIVSTEGDGGYIFPQVPSNVRSLYEIQVHWQGNLIAANLVRHPGQQEPIVIQVP
jgi:hypothetical protein